MELMNNSYLKFPIIEFNGTNVYNISELNLLPDIPDKYFTTEYILYYKVQDDALLEGISFELYKDTNYWDMLMILNDMRSMNELPVNYDIVITRAEKKLAEWKEKGKLLPGFLTDEKVLEKFDEILADEVEKNEKYRTIKYIAQDNLSELDADLDLAKLDAKINKNLIINKE